MDKNGEHQVWPRINDALCRAWGLNPREVQAIAIYFHPHQQPTAVVKLYLNEKVMEWTMNLVPRKDVEDD